MKRIVIILSVMMFIIANVGIAQDIINETGKDGKFIVRDAEQKEALVIEDGNVGITGELSVEKMNEGSVDNPYVVWDPEDKKFKTVARVFSKVSPLSEPLNAGSWHSVGYEGVNDDGISASVQGTAASWNRFTTDFGWIQLGPANTTAAHIYTDATHDKFVFNKPVFTTTGEFSALGTADLFFRTGVTPRMTMLNSNGNMGVGTTTPMEELVLSDDDTDVSFLLQNTTTGGNSTDGFEIRAANNNAHINNQENADLYLGTNNSTDLTIEDGGNVGIGTIDPWAGLHLFGADWPNSFMYLQANTGNDAGFRLYESTTTKWHIFNDASAARFEIRNNAFDPTFVIEQTTGDVGIGIDNPIEQFHVWDNTTDDVVNFQNANTSTGADLLTLDFSAITNPGGGNDYIRFNDVGGYVGYIDGDGAGGINFGTSSDARLKMKIVDLPSALDKVLNIRVRQYEMKSAPGKEQVGFLAQELYEIYPQAVSGTPDNDVNEKPMGIDYGKLTPLLVRAIQELQAEIEILKRK